MVESMALVVPLPDNERRLDLPAGVALATHHDKHSTNSADNKNSHEDIRK